jgi:hypothetical protein
MILSLFFSLFFFILFIIFCIIGGNYILRNALENIVKTKENFQNNADSSLDNSDDSNNNLDHSKINKMDDCKKIDLYSNGFLNFQTATNIPLSPNNYENYVGTIYDDPQYMKNDQISNDLTKGKYCLQKGKLLYDGIWNPQIHTNSGFEHETWNLTNGDLSDGYYCSDKLIEVNKQIPKDFIDKSATPPVDINSGYYYTYFNDIQNDILDTEIYCFPEVFNAGMTPNTYKYYKKS